MRLEMSSFGRRIKLANTYIMKIASLITYYVSNTMKELTTHQIRRFEAAVATMLMIEQSIIMTNLVN